MAWPSRPAEDRFFDKVDASEDCWVWVGALDGGYGRFWSGERTVWAHRWSYEHFIEEIPEGLQIDHLCRNTACVRPDHLEVVTRHENIIRSDAPSGINARKTHCVRGHALTSDNTSIVSTPHGVGRVCRACRRIYNHKYYNQRKAS